MSRTLGGVLGVLIAVLAIGLPGCSEEHPPVVKDSNTVTPAMEKMKMEMMKNLPKNLQKQAEAAAKK